jgi:hypothetical protein
MTTRVRIELPPNNHAPLLDVYTVDNGHEHLEGTLRQGGFMEVWIYTNHHVLCKERFE